MSTQIKRPYSRTQKTKLNMFFSLVLQGVRFVCGLILPKLMIGTFGSEAYGVVNSIGTFLAYISLMEGGLGAVTRSALYKAFANKSIDQVSAVIDETKRMYRKLAYVFVVYVLVIALTFKQISHNSVFDYWYTFWLVIIISASKFTEYYIGITYSLLLQGDQSQYVMSIILIGSTILSTLCTVILIRLKCDILTVKLATCFVQILRPVILAIYVKKQYKLVHSNTNETYLTQKRSAIGQHIAWTLHNNTDVTVLTVFRDAKLVSVYSVYHMIVSMLESVITSFTSGMEAVFGSMYANGEHENLQKTFGYYETLISLLSVTAFSAAAVMIVPFIRIYTSSITDIGYIYPVFGIMMLVASLLYCMRTTYGRMVIAAGHFKKTRIAAYGEAIINIVSSCILVIRLGLVGVAIGTIFATLFRFVFYTVYLSRNILNRPIRMWVKRMCTNAVTCGLIYTVGETIIRRMTMDNYFYWTAAGVIVSAVAGAVTFIFNFLLYRDDVITILKKGFKKAG